jgi:DNA-binding NarL/FixJ family response regulator
MRTSSAAARKPASLRAAWQFVTRTSMDARSILLIGGVSFRLRIKAQLAGSHFDVVAEATTLREALPQLGTRADMDLALLESLAGFGDSIDDLRRIHFLLPSAKLVVLRVQQAVELVRTASSIGIDGCLSPEMPIEALIQSLDCIALGQSLFSINRTTLLFGQWSPDPGAASPHAWTTILSRRGLPH